MKLKCKHCGLESNADFCCIGCSTAYQLIKGLGLQAYYLETDGLTPSVSDKKLSDFEAYDHPSFLQSHSRIVDGIRKAKFYLQGIHCSSCVWLLEKLPRFTSLCLSARVHYSTCQIELEWTDGSSHLSKILKTLTKIGYTPYPFRQGEDFNKVFKEDWIRLGVSGASALASMHIGLLFVAAFGSSMLARHAQILGIFCAIVSAPAIFYGGIPFYRSAFHSLRIRRLHPDLLVSLAALIGYFYGLYRVLRERSNLTSML